MRSLLGFFGRVWSFVGRVLVAVFGRWSPPPWLRFVGRRARGRVDWARAHKAPAAALLLAVTAVTGGTILGVRWWKSRPKPLTTEITVIAPALTRIADKIVPNPVVLDFASSVAPLKSIGDVVKSGIELDPRADGTWKWTSDRQLTFTPRVDWPVGQHYTVKLAKKTLVAPHVRLERYDVSFDTAPFTVTFSDASFYQDPTDPEQKKVVATFVFSHPVDGPSFEQKLALRFEPSNKEDRAFEPKATVSYDKYKVRAFVHSQPFAIPQQDAQVVITLGKGVRAARGGPPADEELSRPVRIPGVYNFFKVESIEPQLVDNPRMEPEQILLVRLSAGSTEKEMGAAVRAWLLPVKNPDESDPKAAGTSKEPYRWSDPDRVSPTVLAAGKKLPLQALPTEKEYDETRSFRYEAEVGRYVYVEVKKGARAWGGYVLGETHTAVVQVPPYPRQLKLLHSGSLLALGGDKRLSVFARDVPGIRFEIARFLPDQLHHLASQARGRFGQPGFPYEFGPENLADFQVETRALHSKPGKPTYEALDLARYLSDGRRGLFLVRAQSWDPASKGTFGEEDRRLVMVTDLGLLAKRSADGGQDVFVQNVRSGTPEAGVKVQVVGKNGVPILSGATDAQGHVRFPSLQSFRAEKEPVMYLATQGRDSAFLPIGRGDRTLDLSRFDVGGVTEASGAAQGLAAYLFSDRGVYRPGDELRIGMVVKARDWSQPVDGLPLVAEVLDARGLEVKRQRITLGPAGFEELRHTTPEVAPTGQYTVNLYTVKDDHADALLGSTTVSVREFLPDRMIIKAQLSEERVDGWVNPTNLKGRVTLTNLFGTPAAEGRIRAQVNLVPGLPTFAKLHGYRFFDPLKAKEPVTQPLSEARTGEDGSVQLDLGLERYGNATYRLTLQAEGFEADGGRSVSAEAGVVVSPLAFLVGWKPDGDLSYLSLDSAHTVDFIAVGPTGDRRAQKGLSIAVLERKYVSVLTRRDNGTYGYESKKKEVELRRQPLAIAAGGTAWKLPTDQPGDFALSVRNDRDEELQRVEFTVAGTANVARAMDKNAELQLSLKSADLEPGGTIELQIKAPYTGAGLITVERDRVYAWKWFKTSTTATVESIVVPPELEGGGYVSVAFIRDPASDEVFASPLSHGVVPFSMSRARRAVDVRVTTPDLARPGEPFRIKVRADKKARAVVFAVDEGILRVARYSTPDPLGYFFQKRALGVSTSQILDLILPEHERLLRALAPGGDAEGEAAIGANLNPFKRRREKPVVYWSGLVDVGPSERELVYDVPDAFAGSLRVMAVAIAPEAVGAFEKKAVVRGDFVINPNAPTFVAPGDTFDVPVAVSNNVAGSGKKPVVVVTLETSPHVEVIGSHRAELPIAEMREGTVRFKLRAKEALGSASLTFKASLGDRHGKLTTDLSVRPSTPFLTTLQVGYVKGGRTKVDVPRRLYAEYRDLQAGVSPVPLQLAHGLVAYLEKFPHGCTEQVVSQAVPAVALGTHPEFGFKPGSIDVAIARLVDVLRTRQNDEGAFGLWAANPRVVPEVSAYALHVLMDARDRGHAVPPEVVRRGLDYLQALAGRTPESLPEARTRAHAIYVLTRSGMVTSHFVAAAIKNLDANYTRTWKNDLAGAYLASAQRLLKQEGPARALIASAKLGQPVTPEWEDYTDSLSRDGLLLYLLARHFPERAAAVTKPELDAIVAGIAHGSYNTHSSAAAIMGLEAYAERATAAGAGTRTLAEVVDGVTRPLTVPPTLLPLVPFSDKASALLFGSEGDFGAYYVVTQGGFDRAPPTKPVSAKIEVFREYVDADGKPIKGVKLGDEIRVRLRMRALQGNVSNVAIVDLLPGGFEAVVQPPKAAATEAQEQPSATDDEGQDEESAAEGEPVEDERAGEEDSEAAGTLSLPIMLPESTYVPEYGDVREDRVVLYGDLGPDAATFVYAIKATAAGQFVVPPVQAEGLYDRAAQARGAAGALTVKAP